VEWRRGLRWFVLQRTSIARYHTIVRMLSTPLSMHCLVRRSTRRSKGKYRVGSALQTPAPSSDFTLSELPLISEAPTRRREHKGCLEVRRPAYSLISSKIQPWNVSTDHYPKFTELLSVWKALPHTNEIRIKRITIMLMRMMSCGGGNANSRSPRGQPR
jgi:hypothetical protein